VGEKRQKLKTCIPRDMYVPLIVALLANGAAYYGSRLLTGQAVHLDMTTPLDERIPVLPWTVSIYFGCYAFWVVNYIIGSRQDKQSAYRFLSADFLAKIICLVIFLLLPTTNVRPEIYGSSVWDELMRFLYRTDAADNLFPSIHCLTSWFSFLAVRKNKAVSGWYRWTSLGIAVMICFSTLTTKQHVIWDVIAGVALAEGSFWIVRMTGFAKWYRYTMMRINRRIIQRRSVCL
jgi:membrane-associated phospholipid phosphatase